MRIAIIGAGAMGGLFGGSLAEAGYEGKSRLQRRHELGIRRLAPGGGRDRRQRGRPVPGRIHRPGSRRRGPGARCGRGTGRIGAAVAKAFAGHRNHKASMLQDVLAGRRTEIEQINGAIARAGSAAGIPTPVIQTLADLVRLIDQSLLSPDAPLEDMQQ